SCAALDSMASGTVGIASTATVLATAASSARWPLAAALRLAPRSHFPNSSSRLNAAVEPWLSLALLNRSRILSKSAETPASSLATRIQAAPASPTDDGPGPSVRSRASCSVLRDSHATLVKPTLGYPSDHNG